MKHYLMTKKNKFSKTINLSNLITVPEVIYAEGQILFRNSTRAVPK